MPGKPVNGLVFDAVSTFEAGVNSGVEPLLLPKNQCSFATNVTFRGGFITNRPPVRKMTLDFGGDAVLQANFSNFIFQGACFYNSDYATQSLVAAIGGKQFELRFNPADPTTWAVTDISISGDPNPPEVLQNWLFQAERWVIINDGQSLPIFWDGTSSRRSLGPSALLATVAAPGFVAPAIGSSVQVNVSTVYDGPFNIPVLVNDGAAHTAIYTILPAAPLPSQPNARLKMIFQNGGTVSVIPDQITVPSVAVPIGAQVLSIPSRIGILWEATAPNVGEPEALGTTNPPSDQKIIFFSGALTAGAIQLSTWNIASRSLDAIVASPILPSFNTSVKPHDFLYEALGTKHPSSIFAVPQYSVISYSNPNPNTLIGTVQTGFNSPDYNHTVDVVLDQPYTGPDNTPVWIGNALYLVSQIPPPAPSSTVTLVNETDTAGFAYAAGVSTISSVAELPPSRMGAYGMGRVWVSLVDGRQFIAGDIVGGSSGSAIYSFRDAVLKTTENSYLAGGGTFVVPGSIGDIRAMIFEATLDASLGQGPLQVFTSKTVFSCNTPVDRTVWQSITNPILTESLRGAGAMGQNSTVNANGDTMFRSTDGIRSLILARREFDVWGNVPQSREIQSILNLDNASLLQYGSAIVFDNRELMTCIPSSGARGIFHQGLTALNFDTISNLRGKSPSIYDGFWTGLNICQMVTGVFNGVERAYAFCINAQNLQIELYEILPTGNSHFDNDQLPITMSFETPVFFRPKSPEEMVYLRLEAGEIAVSDLVGVVMFQVWFRSDENQCWTPWRTWTVCANNFEAGGIPQFRPRMGFGSPPQDCDNVTNRPMREGYYFQCRIQITGQCRVKRIKLMASIQPEPEFAPPICAPLC